MRKATLLLPILMMFVNVFAQTPANKMAIAGDEKWDYNFATAGVNGLVRCVFADSTNVYVGGVFTKAGGINAANIAMWDGKVWINLNGGIGATVYPFKIKKHGSDIYVAGSNGVDKWNGTAWINIGTITGAINGNLGVNDLDFDASGNLFVTGSFVMMNGVTVNNVAKWNGTAWSALGIGIDATPGGITPNAIAVQGNTVFIAGGFSSVSGIAVNNIAKWNGTSWSALSSGLTGTGSAISLAVKGTDVFVGCGGITAAGGVPVNNIAKWNGSSWSAVGAGLNDGIYDLKVLGNDLYAGGLFTQSGSTSINKIAKWNGTTWTDAGNGLRMDVYGIGISSQAFVAGGYTDINDTLDMHNVARWNGSSWVSIGNGMNNLVKSFVNCLALDSTTVYAGGSFTQAGGLAVNRIAKWDGVKWDSLGSGFIAGEVNDIAIIGNTLYAGGSFTLPGASSTSYIAKWDGSTWSAVGAGVNNKVFTLEVYGNDLYVGGLFTQAGGVNNNHIAKWDGSAWSNLGNGTNDIVKDIKVAPNGTLYAAGGFTVAGSVLASRIAKWDGTTWSAVGSGVNDMANAIGISPANELYLGGQFDIAVNSVVVNHITKFNGTTWVAVGGGLSISGNVYSILFNCNDMFIGGDFTTAGGTTVNSIAKWDGSAWSSLGSGMNNDPTSTETVMAMASHGNNLFVGGYFAYAGDKRADRFAHFLIDGIPSVSITPATASICAGTSVTFTAQAVNAGAAPTYQWLINNSNAGSNASTFTPNTIKNGDTIQVLVSTNPACNASTNIVSNVVTVTVDSLVVPNVILNGTLLTVTNPDANAIYTWQVQTAGVWNDIIPTVTGTTFNFTTTGNYRVRTTKGGCTEFSNVQTITALSEINDANSINLFPNPAIDKLILEIPFANGVTNITVVNALSQTMLTQKAIGLNNVVELNIQSLPIGLYFLNVKNGDNSFYSRFVKK